jgi:hypothetical protein
MAGQTFGGKATSYDYRNIMGVEVRTGFSQDEFEVIVGGLATPAGNRDKDRIKAAEPVDVHARTRTGVSHRNILARPRSGRAVYDDASTGGDRQE